MDQFIAIFEPLLAVFAGEPWVQAAILALVALLAAYVLTAILKNLSLRIARRTPVRFDDQLPYIIRPPIFYSVLMLGLSGAITILPISVGARSMIFSGFSTIGILVWTLFIYRLVRILLSASAQQTSRVQFIHPRTLPMFENLVSILAIVVAVYLVFQSWGVDMTAWIASAGVAGIAIGFAAKDTLSNFISGIFILADAPYKIGDYVVMDTGERGEITDIGLRSTRMLTRDDVELTIPNSVMGNSKIINESGGPHEKYRIRVPVGVAYGSDIDQVRGILMEVAQGEADVCGHPEPRVRFRSFGGSSLDFELLCWVEQPPLRGRVIDTLLTAIYKRFNLEAVEIPYAKQDIYIKEMPPAKAQ